MTFARGRAMRKRDRELLFSSGAFSDGLRSVRFARAVRRDDTSRRRRDGVSPGVCAGDLLARLALSRLLRSKITRGVNRMIRMTHPDDAKPRLSFTIRLEFQEA